MRKYLKLLLFLAVAFVTLAFTWEGELDPNDFDKWKVISVQPTSKGLVWMFVKNPDQTSPIEIVSMAVGLNLTLFGYRYFKYGIPYSYVFNAEQDKYVEYKFTKEEKNTCMECHKDEIIKGEAI